MGKFSLKKDKGDGGEDSSRLALFGSRSKSKSPAPPTQNPYAQSAIPPDPYTRAKMSAGLLPQSMPQEGLGSAGLPRGPSQAGYGGSASQNSVTAQDQRNPYAAGNSNPYGRPQNSYGSDDQYGGASRGYGAEKFGNPNGYGAGSSGGNPYATFSQTSGAGRTGGYGGLGGTTSNDTAVEADRSELFGGARERLEQKQQSNPGGPPGYEYNSEHDTSQDRAYGAYGDRQLTAEEEEEEDITATKQEIKFMKQQDVSSTRNALRIAAQAEETGRSTLARLGAQGERMHNTDRNLDIGNNHINIAEDRAKELKTLNRSMFAVHVNNPFTGKDRRAKRDEQIMDRHHSEREQREATRETAFKTTQRMNHNFKGLDDTYAGQSGKKDLTERAKYQFEADSEDDAMEDEIDRNLDDLSGAAKRLNLLARATGDEVEQQNKLIANIAEKSDRFDDRLHLQTERLKRIR